MSIPYPNAKVQDGNWNTATPSSLPEFICPIPAVNAEYVFTQEWQLARNVLNTGGPPVPLGTAHPDYPTYFLVAEAPKQDVGAGAKVKWKRTYAQVPATYFEPEMFAYSFIGITGISGINVPTIQGRGRQQRSVISRIQHDFFLVPSTVTDPILGTSLTLASDGDIPKIWSMEYVYQVLFNGITYGGLFYPTDTLNPAGATSPTIPTSDDYQNKMMADALQNGWKAKKTIQVFFPINTVGGGSGHYAGAIDVGSSTLGGMICVEDSQLQRWMGPIFLRKTRWALAQ